MEETSGVHLVSSLLSRGRGRFLALVLICWFAAFGAGAVEPVSNTDPSDHGRLLLDQAVESLGDAERFDQLRAVRIAGSSYSDSQATSQSHVDMLAVFPEDSTGLWMHIVSSGSDGVTFDRRLAGDRSWARGIGILPPDLHQDALRYASTKLFALLRHRNAPDVEVSYLGVERAEDLEVDTVQVILEGTRCILELNRQTHLPVAVRFSSSPIQESVEGQIVRRIYSDYRELDGFLVPFRQTVTVGGEYYNQWDIETFDLESEYDSTIFDVLQ